MKFHSNSQEMLFGHLSTQGDITAFFLLFKPLLIEQYLKEKKSGTADNEAIIHTTAFASDLFETFLSVPMKKRFSWIEEHRCLLSPADNNAKEIVIDNINNSETAYFIQHCFTQLMKTASRLRKKQIIQKKSLFNRILHSTVVPFICIPLAILLGIGYAILFFMEKTDTTLYITITSQRHNTTIMFPPEKAAESDAFEHLTSPHISDSIVKDTAETMNKDTTQTMANTKNHSTMVLSKTRNSHTTLPPVKPLNKKNVSKQTIHKSTVSVSKQNNTKRQSSRKSPVTKKGKPPQVTQPVIAKKIPVSPPVIHNNSIQTSTSSSPNHVKKVIAQSVNQVSQKDSTNVSHIKNDTESQDISTNSGSSIIHKNDTIPYNEKPSEKALTSYPINEVIDTQSQSKDF